VRIQSERSPWGDAIRRNFSDSRTRTVITIIPRIVGAIAAIAAAKKANRVFEVRRQAAAQKAAREYEVLQRRRAHEQKAVALLDKLLAEQEAEVRLRSLANTLREGNGDNSRMELFLQWLDRRLLETGATNSPAALEKRLAEAGLFDPDEDT